MALVVLGAFVTVSQAQIIPGCIATDCYGFCEVCPEQLGPKMAQADTKTWIARLMDTVATTAYATSCNADEQFIGYLNSAQKTNNGSSQRCEAKMHVCYVGGDDDEYIPCSVNTYQECEAACDINTSPNQQACSYSDCYSRCVAARVTGSTTCD